MEQEQQSFHKVQLMVAGLTAEIDEAKGKPPPWPLMDKVMEVLDLIEANPEIYVQFQAGGDKNWMMLDLLLAVNNYRDRILAS